MSSELPTISIGDLVEAGEATIQTGPFGSQLHKYDYIEIGTPVIPTEAIGRGRILDMSVPKVSIEKASELERHRLRCGDILFARRGAQATGLSAIVDSRYDGALCGTGALLLRLSSPRVHPHYLSVFLSSEFVFGWLRTHAVGAVMPNLNTEIIKALPLTLPPLPAQIELSRMFGALDDRITLVRETNATLEAIAQTLFKSWFVDFDPVHAKQAGRAPEGMDEATAALFPDGFEESELGLVPKGWGVDSLYDIATYINGAAYKAFDPNSGCRGWPIVKIAELKAGVTNQTAYSDVTMPEKYRIETGDILFSWSGNPDTSIDTFVWHHGRAWLNQHIFRVVPRQPGDRPFVLQMLRYLRPVFAELARNKQTTGLGHVTVADMKRLEVVRPSKAVLHRFYETAAPIHQRIFDNEQQAQTLATLRDTLLPRLISGRLRLPAAKAAVEGVRVSADVAG